ncbi:BnaC05g47260D [Brassica napus]|uniref:Peroxisome biogenesis protein 12 n=2 Tax=Brassica TaxID=3705 RepID=A0A078HWU5_BRANA|nr:BnaC05g47260D [Brassica napus]
MLFQVGGDGTRPTFFEMAAAQQLPASLRASLTYSLGVFALRRSFLHRILDYEDEFFASLMLVLEGHSLRTTDASFAESLYGLRRKSVRLRLSKGSGEEVQRSGLEKRQRILSVVFLVVLPGNSGNQELSVRVQLATKIKKFVAVCYPWIHASSEGLSFTYQLLYLLDATGFYSLVLQALGIQVCRATGQELMDTSSSISKIRNHERERLRGPPWFKTVQGALLSCSYVVLDYAQTGLIAAVFIFKMMEWWYQSAEERLTAPTVYPPPPPPPSPKIFISIEGIPLPPDRTLCALCLQKLANPSVVTVSGFVFCYSCVFKYVSQYKRCPVTLIPASVDQIRRLFHDT